MKLSSALSLLSAIACAESALGWQLEWSGTNGTNHSVSGQRNSGCIPLRITRPRSDCCPGLCCGDPPPWFVASKGCCVSLFVSQRCARRWATFCDGNSTATLPDLPTNIRSLRVDNCAIDNTI